MAFCSIGSTARLKAFRLGYVSGNLDRAVLEMEFNGAGNGWTVVRDWLRDANLQWTRGIYSNKTSDCVAGVGTANFQLNNSETNSAKKLGYYSPGHPNCRPGFALNIGIRIRFDTTVRWVGRLNIIDPVTGKYGTRRVNCQAVDWIDLATQIVVSNLPVQVNQLGNIVLSVIINSLDPASRPPGGLFIKSASPDIFPYTLDKTRDEQTTVQAEMYRIGLSGLAKIYLDGAGRLIYESRLARSAENSVTPVDSFVASHGVSAPLNAANITNKVQVSVYPRLPGSTDVVMYSMTQPTQIAVGQTITMLGPWTDPNTPNVRVGAVSLVSLVSGTDYLANSAANGSGTDLTASLTVVPGLSGNATQFTITLGGGTSGYITKLQQRGKPLYDYGETVLTAKNDASIAAFGTKTSALQLSYQADPVIGQEFATLIASAYNQPRPDVNQFTRIIGFTNTAEIARSIRREISDLIFVSDELTALGNNFFINHISETVTEATLKTEWQLAFPLDTTKAWALEVVGRGELDSHTILGYGSFGVT